MDAHRGLHHFGLPQHEPVAGDLFEWARAWARTAWCDDSGEETGGDGDSGCSGCAYCDDSGEETGGDGGSECSGCAYCYDSGSESGGDGDSECSGNKTKKMGTKRGREEVENEIEPDETGSLEADDASQPTKRAKMDPMPVLNAYEQQRLERIRQNNEARRLPNFRLHWRLALSRTRAPNPSALPMRRICCRSSTPRRSAKPMPSCRRRQRRQLLRECVSPRSCPKGCPHGAQTVCSRSRRDLHSSTTSARMGRSSFARCACSRPPRAAPHCHSVATVQRAHVLHRALKRFSIRRASSRSLQPIRSARRANPSPSQKRTSGPTPRDRPGACAQPRSGSAAGRRRCSRRCRRRRRSSR
jgi:hypothetical protein